MEKENKDYKYLVSSLYCYFRQANEALNNIYNIIEENPEMMNEWDFTKIESVIDVLIDCDVHYRTWDLTEEEFDELLNQFKEGVPSEFIGC